MNTGMFFIAALLSFRLITTESAVNNKTSGGTRNDTVVIREITKELYICTCKPNTSNPGGNGMLYFQGKYKQDLVTKDLDYRDCDERFLILWDLSGLPEGAEIIEAKMKLYCHEFSGDKQGQLVYEYITEPWNSEIGYSKKPDTNIDSRIFTAWPKAKQFHSIDITGFVKQWYSKKTPNYGLMGYSINTKTTNSAIFYSSHYPDKAYCPELIIVYQKNK